MLIYKLSSCEPSTLDVGIYSPPVESLLCMGNAKSPWPEEVMHNDVLVREIKKRLLLKESLDAIYRCVPRADTNLYQAIDTGVIKERDAIKIYYALANLFEDQTNDRLILYLPFEFIPARGWFPQSKVLFGETRRFMQLYIEGWERLLSVTDVRANFVDGDIPEQEIRDEPLPRVVKAAHLIPKLVEKGLLSVSAIGRLIEDNPATTLETSIVDILPVLADMGLIKKGEWHENTVAIGATEASLHIAEYNHMRIADLSAVMHQEVELAISQLSKRMPVARLRWLTNECKRGVVETYASHIADAIISNSLHVDDLLRCASLGDNGFTMLAAIVAVRKAVEGIARTSKEKAGELYRRYESLMQNAWCERNSEVQDALAVTWLH